MVEIPKIPLPKKDQFTPSENVSKKEQESQKIQWGFREAAESLGRSYMRTVFPTLYKLGRFDEKEEQRDTSTARSYDDVRGTMGRVSNELNDVNQNLASIGINQVATIGLLGEILSELKSKKSGGVDIPNIPDIGGPGGKGKAKPKPKGRIAGAIGGLLALTGLSAAFLIGSTTEAGSEEEKQLDKMTGPERQKFLEDRMKDNAPPDAVPLPPERPVELLGDEEKKKRASAYFEQKKAGILDNTELTGQELREQIGRLEDETKNRFGVSDFPKRGSVIVGPQSSLSSSPVSAADLPSQNATPVSYTPSDTTRSGFMIPGESGVSANIQQIKEQQAEKETQQDIFYNAERMIFAADEIEFKSKEDENTRSASVMNLTDAQRSFLAPQMGGGGGGIGGLSSPAGTTGPSFGLTAPYGPGAGTAGGTGEIPEHLKTGENGLLKDEQLADIGIQGMKAKPEAAAAFKAMRAAAAADGVNLGVTGAYRTLQRQIELKKEKPTLAATPGKSNHGWGLAFDMDFGSNVNSPGFQWMAKNARRFGISGPLPSPYEPWHWTYIGGEDPTAVAQATKMQTGGGAGEGASPGGSGSGVSATSSAPKTATPIAPTPSSGAAIATASSAVGGAAPPQPSGKIGETVGVGGGSSSQVSYKPNPKISNASQAGSVEPEDADTRWKDLGWGMSAVF